MTIILPLSPGAVVPLRPLAGLATLVHVAIFDRDARDLLSQGRR